MEKKSFLTHQNTYLCEHIKFADIKAGASATINIAIITIIFPCVKLDLIKSVNFFRLIGIIVLVISIMISLIVMFPRTSNKNIKGIIFWGNIVQMDCNEYIEEVTNIDNDELSKRFIEQNYYLSKTCNRKYNSLKWGFISTFIGYSLLIISAILSLY